jgi:hypothetical protein
VPIPFTQTPLRTAPSAPVPASVVAPAASVSAVSASASTPSTYLRHGLVQMLRNANDSTPSVLNLQVALALLQQHQPQLRRLLDSANAPSASHAAFQLLLAIDVPDASCGWLMQRAQQLRLNTGAVQEMRLQLRLALLDTCTQQGRYTLPCAQPLPEAGPKPLPLLQPSDETDVADADATRTRWQVHGLYAAACALLAGALVASLILWLPSMLDSGASHLDMSINHGDVLLLLLLAAAGVPVAWRWARARVAVCVVCALTGVIVAASALELILKCADAHKPLVPAHGASTAHIDEAHALREAPAEAAWVAHNRSSSEGAPGTPGECTSLRGQWPVILCVVVALSTILQLSALCVHRQGRMREREEGRWPTWASPPEGAASTSRASRWHGRVQ